MEDFILTYFFVLNVEDDGCSLDHISWTWPQWSHCSMDSWPSLLLCWRKSIFCFYRVGNIHGDLTDEHDIINQQLEKHPFSAIMVLHWQKRTLSSPQWAACLTEAEGGIGRLELWVVTLGFSLEHSAIFASLLLIS